MEEVVNLSMPSAYVPQYVDARKHDAKGVDNYIRHTVLGDPELDPIMEELTASVSPEDLHRFIRAGIEGEGDDLRKAPQSLRDFFDKVEVPPPWLDYDAFHAGVRSFNVNVDLMLAAFVAGVLVEGFATLIAKSFNITGRVATTTRRLQQNNRHLMEIFFPDGLQRDNDGWKLSVRIRFVHARVRCLLAHSEQWDHEAWGTPLSAANLGFAISVFSKRLLDHAALVGAEFTEEEKTSVIDVWRYAGYLMGIPETILYRNREEAEAIYQIAHLCEPPPDADSVHMANTLIQSIPEVAGIEKPSERKKTTTLAYRISRALIGNDLADQFEYPKSSTWGTLFVFRLKQHIQRRLQGSQLVRLHNFTQLLQISMYDRGGVSYRMPDNVLQSKSHDW